jgi:UDP-N-acetyl-2-amino-2-deoxyglucuronate dehydrogenase
MTLMRIAIIGCGAIAEKHVAAIAELGGGAEIAALCDISEERLRVFAFRAGIPRFPGATLHTDIDDMLTRPELDLVVVATSSDSHARIALRSLEAGKHVLVEKPLALSMGEARELIRLARAKKLELAVSFQARYSPRIAAMKAAVEEGRFGEIGHGAVAMRWNRDMAYYRSGPWREDWSKGGGLFINQCIHYVDLLIWLLGPLQSVYALAGIHGQFIGVENVGAALLRFKSGAVGIIEASTGVYPRTLGTSISLFGSRGTASFEGTALQDAAVWTFEHNHGSEGADSVSEQRTLSKVPDTDIKLSHTPLYRELLTAIRGGESPIASAESTLPALEAVLGIYQSIKSGLVVELPINEEFHMGGMVWREKG